MNIHKSRFSAGFSLVEIMVGMTIGLITVLVVSQVMQVAEARKRSSTSGSDALVNATLGLYSIERDGRNAGYGMTSVNSSIGCPVRGLNGAGPRNFILAPVAITNGTNANANAPDTLRFMASNKNGITLPARIAVDHPVAASNLFVESDMGVEAGDMMIAVPAAMNTWCSIFQVTAIGGSGGGSGSAQNQISRAPGQSGWNNGAAAVFPSSGYMAGDHVVNVGSFLDHTYTIQNNFLHLTDYRMPTHTFAELDLYPNIVQLQAVYGKDTSIPADNIVNVWNADAPTSAPQWKQVIAIRVALVARGQSPEPGVVTLDGANAASTCDSATPHPAAVCWRPTPNGNGVKIDVSSDANWQRYRYRVLETTIPLRNAIWRQ